MKICLTCATGGHFMQMMRIMEAIKGYEHFFITSYEETTKDLDNVYYLSYTDSKSIGFYSFLKFIKSFFQTMKILLKERPDVIISTGSGVTIPVCSIGKILGAKVIFIETLARVISPSMTGKIIYPIANLFLVQWGSLLKKYGKKAKYWGKVI